MTLRKAVRFIENVGIALVYPLPNQTALPSLWDCYFPNQNMDWSWNADSHDGIAEIWDLRRRLASSREVVYSKWFRGRACVFAKSVFSAAWCLNLKIPGPQMRDPSREAQELIEVLIQSSPRSTLELKRELEWQGKDMARVFDRATREQFRRLELVGLGEVPDGAFPSLAYAASRTVFEELYHQARSMPVVTAAQSLLAHPNLHAVFLNELEKHRCR